ncbi:MAG: extracellular solute-binding protein [Lachnospiraceae bacterium]|nr:extracellular solute-binding protein [Lachnospiraceae bacterium]
MKKRIMALLLTFAMAVGLLAGCNAATSNETTAGNDETKAPAATDTPTEAPTDEAEVSAYPIVDEPITIKVAVVDEDLTNPTRLVYERMAELTGINVELISIEKDQFNVYLASNDWPDMFMEGLNASTVYEYGVLGQMLVDYQDYLDIMPNLAKAMEDYPDMRRMSVQEDGGIYALPRIEFTNGLPMTRVHYSSDFLEKNNLKEPTTLDEFYDVLVKCRDLNNGAAPLTVSLKSGSQYTAALIFPAFGEYGILGYCVGEDGVVVDSYTTEQYREYLKYMNKLYEEGLLHEEYSTLDNNALLGLIQEGTGIFWAECATAVTPEMFSDGELHIGTLSPLVMNEGDTPACIGVTTVKNANSFAINANSPYVEEICKWVDVAFATEEVAEGTGLYGVAFSFGIVGEMIHFNDEDHTYIQTYPDGTEGVTTDWVYKNSNIGQYGLCDLSEYVSAGGNVGVRLLGYRDKVMPYCTIPVYPTVVHTAEEQETLDQYSTEQESYKKSMCHKFIMGVEDIDDDAVWQDYLDTMKSYHTDEIVAIKQAAYDRYMAQ